MPDGTFSLLPGNNRELGAALVSDPRIKAVGFTGSRGGGLALMTLAAQRPEPIPVYAEMSSINPVVLMPAALEARAEAIGAAFVQSLTMGAGQFCTNPGLVLAVDSPALDRFVAAAAEALGVAPGAVMLSPGIHASLRAGASTRSPATRRSAPSRAAASAKASTRRVGALFETDAASFLADPALGHEVFGSSSLVDPLPRPRRSRRA